MKIATIHRNEHDNVWIVLVRDSIRETRTTHKAESLSDAEALAQREGAHRIKVSLGESV